MEALVAYYRKFETVVPDFRAVVTLGDKELAREEFRGRSTESASTRRADGSSARRRTCRCDADR